MELSRKFSADGTTCVRWMVTTAAVRWPEQGWCNWVVSAAWLPGEGSSDLTPGKSVNTLMGLKQVGLMAPQLNQSLPSYRTHTLSRDVNPVLSDGLVYLSTESSDSE